MFLNNSVQNMKIPRRQRLRSTFISRVAVKLIGFFNPTPKKWAQANSRCLPLHGGLALEARPHVPLYAL